MGIGQLRFDLRQFCVAPTNAGLAAGAGRRVRGQVGAAALWSRRSWTARMRAAKAVVSWESSASNSARSTWQHC